MSRRSGRTCAVNGCSNSSGKLQKWNKTECKEHRPLLYENCPCLRPFSLHRFPGRAEHKNVLQKWVENINRKDFVPNINSTVCGVHFPEGKPTKENPYPVLHMGYDHYGAMSGQGPPKRRCLKSLAINTSCVESEKSAIEDNVTVSHFDIEPLLESDVDVQWSEDQAIAAEHNYCSKLTTDCATQTDPAPSLSAHDLNEEDSKFFTGIGVHCFWQLLYALVALVPQPMIMTLADHDQLLLVLMRLRLGLMFRDLSKRFGISRSTASEIFSLWRPILAKFMRENVIAWLPRNTLKRIRPQHFSEHYPHVTCIVGCTELCVQKYLKNIPQMHSNSKQLNTYKVLYCMAPNGYVMFVSKLFDVEASDGFITKNSGFADHLIPGDQILAGHGFSNTDELPPGVTLATFTQDYKELSEHEVTEMRRFANFKIHFERALNRLKGFKILSNVIPHTVKHVDDIVSICAGLCNLQP